jgi:hypothetical protein
MTPLRPPRPGSDEPGQPLRENAAWTAAIGTEERSHLQVEHDAPRFPGKIRHRVDTATAAWSRINQPVHIYAAHPTSWACTRNWMLQAVTRSLLCNSAHQIAVICHHVSATFSIHANSSCQESRSASILPKGILEGPSTRQPGRASVGLTARVDLMG